MGRDGVPEEVEEVVVRLYDAALEPRAWRSTLAHVAGLVGGSAALYVGTRPAADDIAFAHAFGLDGELLVRSILSLCATTARLEESVCERTAAITSRCGAVDARGAGTRDTMQVLSSVVDVDSLLIVRFAALRRVDLGPFDARDVARFEALTPHLVRVARLQLKLGVLQAERDALLESLEPASAGVIIVDEEQRVVFANAAAREIADAADGLSIRSAELFASSVKETKALRELLCSATSRRPGEEPVWCGTIGLTRPSLRRPLGVEVLAVSCTPSHPSSTRRVVIVFVSDPERQVEAPIDRLVELYGVTPAEAALAQVVARGTGLTEAADELGISMNTARTHLKRVFQKTGTRRQAELVRLFLSGVPQVR